MDSTQPSSRIEFTLAEEGEAFGTVQQFSDRLNLPASQVMPCLQEHDAQPILLRDGSPPSQLLILDSGGLDALRDCTAPETAET